MQGVVRLPSQGILGKHNDRVTESDQHLAQAADARSVSADHMAVPVPPATEPHWPALPRWSGFVCNRVMLVGVLLRHSDQIFCPAFFQFLELMYWKYHEKAAEKGVYIIGSSGFDSIPADLGVIYTSNKINGNY